MSVTLAAALWATVLYGEKKAARKGFCTPVIRYPKLTDDGLAKANDSIVAFADTELKSAVAIMETAIKGQPAPKISYLYETNGNLTCHTKFLASVLFESTWYTVRVHTNQTRRTLNYALIDGKARPMNLANFFKAGSDYKNLVTRLVLAKLRTDNRAIDVRSGRMRTLSLAQRNRFTISETGLTFYVDRSEAAPYAAGDFAVLLYPKEPGINFNKSLLR